MKKPVLKSTPKYVTEPIFEKSMSSVARQFQKIDDNFNKVNDRLDRHEKVFEKILGELEEHRKESQEHRMAMSSLMGNDIRRERSIDDLFIRVEKLEKKVK